MARIFQASESILRGTSEGQPATLEGLRKPNPLLRTLDSHPVRDNSGADSGISEYRKPGITAPAARRRPSTPAAAAWARFGLEGIAQTERAERAAYRHRSRRSAPARPAEEAR